MAEEMIQHNIRINHEFYVAPVYNQGLQHGLTFRLAFVHQMHGLGIPSDLTQFLASRRRLRTTRFIAHRGNRYGANPARENKPDYLMEALAEGFDVEMDVWLMPEGWFLGHDAPEHPVALTFLFASNCWLHCKNGAALALLSTFPGVNCFFHQGDDYTLTSKGYVWTYPNRPLPEGNKTIAVMCGRTQDVLQQNKGLAGICADDVGLVGKDGCRAIVFDLDGVLVESKELHYETLNDALETMAGPQYRISWGEHQCIYDGLSTRQKLALLQLTPAVAEAVFQRKQELTLERIRDQIKPNLAIKETLRRLKALAYPIAVASNCIRQSVHAFLTALDLWDVVDVVFSNEDVKQPKPHPDMYLKVAESFGIQPGQLLIVEDSTKGFEAAVRAGGQLFKVATPADVRLEPLQQRLSESHEPELHIVIPLARPSPSCFWLDGPDQLPVEVPLQLMDMAGQILLQRMCDNIRPAGRRCRWIFLVRETQQVKYRLDSLLPRVTHYEPTVVIGVKTEQLGAMATVLLASEWIDNDTPLWIFDGGHVIQWTSNSLALWDLLQQHPAAVTIHQDQDRRWSYVETAPQRSTVDLAAPQRSTGESVLVTQIREKTPISCKACTGLYGWRHGRDFVKAAHFLRQRNVSYLGQFFISQTLQQCLEAPDYQVAALPVTKSWSLRSFTEIAEFRRSYIPIVARAEWTKIYEEMRQRTTQLIQKIGTIGDAQLMCAEEDPRRCHAVYAFCTLENWQPTALFSSLMERLRSVLPGQLIYGMGTLHFTLLQLIGFDVFSQVQLPANYYEVLQAMLVNRLPAFECYFDSVVCTPKTIMVQGWASSDLNHSRDELRRELKRLNYPLLEPYVSNILHMTLVRFTHPLDSGQLTQVWEIAKTFSGRSLGTLKVSALDMGPASWQMTNQTPVCTALLQEP